MMEIRGWRAWVWDGEQVSRHSSADFRWQELPSEGVVGVVVYLDPPYRRILDGHDWIWMSEGEFDIVPTHPEWGKWADPPMGACRSCLKKGAPVLDDEWARVQAAMLEDRTWPS
jgi:hypothetical protein